MNIMDAWRIINNHLRKGNDFKVGDKARLRNDMGGFVVTITVIHNSYFCTAKAYGKNRHFNMCWLEKI